MTTHWRQKATSTLAIICVIVLLLLLIFLWTAVRNGVFAQNNSNIYSKISLSENRLTTNVQHRIINFDNDTYTTISSSRGKIELPSSKPPYVETPPPSLEDISFDEFVKPSKIHVQPLHAEDLLYESQKLDPGADPLGKVPDHRLTGQFRNKSSRIWDPHPQYLIDAFGLHLHLILFQDGSFIPKDMKITHISKNESYRKKEDMREYEILKGCFYKGRVRGDEHSAVTVSLCDGMRGHIYTSSGSYFIQPVEEYTTENPNILHKISRERIFSEPQIQSQDDISRESQCDACNNKDCTHLTEDISLSNEANFHSRIKRNTPSSLITYNAYTMEVLVAVDRKMQEYHGKNIKAYILTLMSIVSSVYADASIGNSINIAVVHLLLLKDDLHVESNHIGVSASQMLSSFCKFIQQHAFHHDTALLLTREQICRSANQMKCDTLGLAELGTMCRPSSCAIVQDNGLSAAFTIAHELGHVLSMPHDDDTKCAKFRKPGAIQQNIMSRMLDHNTHPWSWSDCSRHYVTEYLENNHGSCMLDKPKHDMIEQSSGDQKFAGEKFSANEQCELVFGHESKVCSYMPTCGRLWCGSDVEGCRTQHMPWADGTECGLNHWCQRGKCVHRNRTALVKVDGGWGSWSQYDTCSRNCGGGVQSATRKCNSPSPANGGKYCIGNRIKYKSCNIHDCHQDALDFREEQCAELNNNNFDIPGIDKNVKWVPKYGASPTDECKLYCRVEKSNNYFQLKEKVRDGTSCTHDSFNKCVNGVCRPAGCNNELSSNAILDKCGVCDGNNDTCIDIHGTFSPKQIEESKKYSKTPYYYHVSKIPKGASNIEIVQPGYLDDLNYIALIDDQGEYILNGYNVITQYPRTFPYGGVTFEYTGTNSTMEKVNTSFARRLKRDLIVEILSRAERYTNSELMFYSYTVSLNESSSHFYPYKQHYNHPQAPPTAYHWKMSDWSECDKLCEGKRFRTAACIQTNVEVKVSPSYCLRTKPMDEYEVCNTNCEIDWEITRSECSHPCGEGVRTLSHKCVQQMTSTNVVNIIEDSHCPITTKPLLYEKCMGPCKSAVWAYDDWGQCTRSCGGGYKSRTASCASHVNGYEIEDHYCSHIQKEDLVTTCNSEDCPTWSYGENTPCSVTCGEGIRSAAIHCKQNNQIVNRALCSSLPRPVEIIYNCTMEPCHRKILASIPILFADEILPTTINNNYFEEHNFSTSTVRPNIYFSYKWRTSRWGPCSVSCGGGISTRSVSCANSTSSMLELVSDFYCTEIQPTNVTTCSTQRCPTWNFGAWGECGNDCKRQRQVVCQDESGKIDDQYCSSTVPPKSLDICCSFKWRNSWTPCSSTCGLGTRKKQHLCMRLYPKSIKNPYPRKKGQAVNKSFCAHLKEPLFYPKVKACKKQCSIPKWDFSPWSKCSVGCGQGYATREVRCMLGNNILNDTSCYATQKPIKTRHCESKNDCLWKTGAWKNCSCAGYTKRRIQCYDSRLNRLSNSCSERDKPDHKKKCVPPPTCSCKGIQLRLGKHTDGEYDLNIRGRKVRIYCHNMNTANPQEYLTLKAGLRENYASYYDKRSKDSNQCPRSRDDEYYDETIPSGITYFSKIRLNLHTLQVIEDDLQYSKTTGHRSQTYGSAGDCYSTTEHCPQGDFSINLVGTRFRIKPSTQWETRGPNSTMIFQLKLEHPYQKVFATCGGYCGSCFPSKITTLQLEIM